MASKSSSVFGEDPLLLHGLPPCQGRMNGISSTPTQTSSLLWLFPGKTSTVARCLEDPGSLTHSALKPNQRTPSAAFSRLPVSCPSFQACDLGSYPRLTSPDPKGLLPKPGAPLCQSSWICPVRDRGGLQSCWSFVACP